MTKSLFDDTDVPTAEANNLSKEVFSLLLPIYQIWAKNYDIRHVTRILHNTILELEKRTIDSRQKYKKK